MKYLAFFIGLTFNTITALGQQVEATPHTTTLYIFSGSDWCAPCIQLEREILSDSSFIKILSEQHIEMKKVDFPQRKKLAQEIIKSNESIAEKFSFDGTFPTLIIFSPLSKRHKVVRHQGETSKNLAFKITEQVTLLHEGVWNNN